MAYNHIDPLSALPKYHQLYKIFLRKIEEGDWIAHQLIPPERELEVNYQVSRTTVRQALSLMGNQGYLYREQGRGTFVAPPKLQQNLNLIKGYSESILERGYKPGQKILFLGYVEPPPRACEQLELEKSNREIFHIKRLRFANNKPIGIQDTYLKLPGDKYITEQELEERGSLYALLEETYGLIPTEAIETLEATLADEGEATLLNIHVGSPLLAIERTVWSQHHSVMEYLEASYRGDMYKYYARQTR